MIFGEDQDVTHNGHIRVCKYGGSWPMKHEVTIKDIEKARCSSLETEQRALPLNLNPTSSPPSIPDVHQIPG